MTHPLQQLQLLPEGLAALYCSTRMPWLILPERRSVLTSIGSRNRPPCISFDQLALLADHRLHRMCHQGIALTQ